MATKTPVTGSTCSVPSLVLLIRRPVTRSGPSTSATSLSHRNVTLLRGGTPRGLAGRHVHRRGPGGAGGTRWDFPPVGGEPGRAPRRDRTLEDQGLQLPASRVKRRRIPGRAGPDDDHVPDFGHLGQPLSTPSSDWHSSEPILGRGDSRRQGDVVQDVTAGGWAVWAC